MHGFPLSRAHTGWDMKSFQAPQAGELETEGLWLFPAFLELPGLCVVGGGGGVSFFGPWGLAPFCAKCKHMHIRVSANTKAGSTV